MRDIKQSLSEYNAGEYYSTDLSSRHSSTDPKALGQAINEHVEYARKYHNKYLDVVGMSDYMNDGSVRVVFKVK